MTEHEDNIDLKTKALQSLSKNLQRRLDHEDYEDIGALLPDSFASDLLNIAWECQFDLDKLHFRSAMKVYLRKVSKAVAEHLDGSNDY